MNRSEEFKTEFERARKIMEGLDKLYDQHGKDHVLQAAFHQIAFDIGDQLRESNATPEQKAEALLDVISDFKTIVMTRIEFPPTPDDDEVHA